VRLEIIQSLENWVVLGGHPHLEGPSGAMAGDLLSLASSPPHPDPANDLRELRPISPSVDDKVDPDEALSLLEERDEALLGGFTELFLGRIAVVEDEQIVF